VDATDKFTGKAQVYMRHRPGYPNACLDDLAKICGLGQGSVVADIGAGTGILTRQLLDRGYAVYAIEPNDDMRHAAENALAGNVRFAFVSGTAENTGLDPHSVDLVTAAQSFHWFDHERFRLECMRILKPDAYAALIWNSRDPKSEINTENADICKRLCPQFNGFSGGINQPEELFREFFRNGLYDRRTYRHDLEYDLEGFIGRNLSASYAPAEGASNRDAFVQALTALFRKHERNGHLTVPNVTRSYIGRV
jgi:SAM-dependent methyltransferase